MCNHGEMRAAKEREARSEDLWGANDGGGWAVRARTRRARRGAARDNAEHANASAERGGRRPYHEDRVWRFDLGAQMCFMSMEHGSQILQMSQYIASMTDDTSLIELAKPTTF